MVLECIIPSDDTDYVELSRFYAVSTAGSLLMGNPLLATGVALLQTYILQVFAFPSASKQDSDILGTWFILSAMSAVAGFASWALLLLSTFQEDYRTWFFGTALQKVWAVILGYVLYTDLLESAPSKPASRTDGATRKRPELSKRSSLRNIFQKLRVRVIQGRNLVAKDFSVFKRQNTSSDPYVRLMFGQNPMGKTSIVYKTLNPQWEDPAFTMTILPKSVEVYKCVELYIFDHDHVSKDDAMGTVIVPIPQNPNVKVTKWYTVENGTGDNYCHDASGELLVEIELID